MYNISNDEKYFDEAFLKIPGLVGRATEQPEFLVHSDGGAPHFEVIIVTNSIKKKTDISVRPKKRLSVSLPS